jgi:arabinofuranosyltransferase
METNRRQRVPPGLLVILAAASALYAVFIARTAFSIGGITYFTLVDDAMVSMRYAEHLAHGFGLVWNVGQKPVEGFTNPAWMLIMSAFHLLPISSAKISLGIMVLSALILLSNVVIVYRLCDALGPETRLAPLAAAGLTAFYFPLIFWSLRGMEVGLLVLLIDSAALIAVQINKNGNRRAALLLGMLLAFAVLVRLDAIIQAFIILGYLFARRVSRKMAFLPLLIVAVTLIAILLFQHTYFGDYLPNTYYQKMGGTSAWERVRNGILVFYQHALWDTALPAIVAGACLIVYKDFRRPETFLLAALFAGECAYSVWVGGDYAEAEVNAANRFITQGMPALIILLSLALDRLLRNPRRKLAGRPAIYAVAVTALGLVALAVMSGGPWQTWVRNNAPLLQADIRRTRLGLFIAKNTAPEAVIAVHAAGQIPYYSGRTTIDLLGLNDPVIAKGPVSGPFYPGHDKWNYEYSIQQLQPDLIADNWIKLAAFMKGQAEYRRLDNGIYVRKDSVLVDAQSLSQEYR